MSERSAIKIERELSVKKLPSSKSLSNLNIGNNTEQSIYVAVRIRPLSTKELNTGHEACCQVVDKNHMFIRKNGDSSSYLKSQCNDVVNEYAFDRVFSPIESQVSVYEDTLKKFLPQLIDGRHLTMFAYGATGAGKTHTMFGNTYEPTAQDGSSVVATFGKGVISQAVEDIFCQIENEKSNSSLGEKWSVCLSFLEVYNDQVYDMLEPSGKVLAVREDSDKGIIMVSGLTETGVSNVKEVMELIERGQKHRKMEPTNANVVSSRSHAVIQIVLRHTKRMSTGEESIIESKLSLIDLAGSERASATNNRGARLQEGANINKSLLALANCINALAENSLNPDPNKRLNVKYRDSKLTHLLKSSLEGKCVLVMIANINPSNLTYEDSLHTLLYANRAKNIKVNPLVKENVLDSTAYEREVKLKEENALLKEQLAKSTEMFKKVYTENQELQEELNEAWELVEKLQSQVHDHQQEQEVQEKKKRRTSVLNSRRSMGTDYEPFVFEPLSTNSIGIQSSPRQSLGTYAVSTADSPIHVDFKDQESDKNHFSFMLEKENSNNRNTIEVDNASMDISQTNYSKQNNKLEPIGNSTNKSNIKKRKFFLSKFFCGIGGR